MNIEFFKTKKFMLHFFFAVAILQLGLPAAMIVRYEDVIRNGTQYKFRTAPVDPYDAFRGRYVALSMREDSVRSDGESFNPCETVYVVVITGDDGFAKFTSAHRTPPVGKGDYIKMKTRWGSDSGETRLEIPFDRFYMNEHLAPEAEKAYFKASRQDNDNTFVAVRVKNGHAVIENLYLDGTPVLEILQPTGK
ncbi:MAG: GDYXXLXY domain-containing protein [Victivallales bacterium]|nr:GDYXXLXY domain-containing protein [Victivallales bacterium]